MSLTKFRNSCELILVFLNVVIPQKSRNVQPADNGFCPSDIPPFEELLKASESQRTPPVIKLPPTSVISHTELRHATPDTQ